jgi:hypothetical protein
MILIVSKYSRSRRRRLWMTADAGERALAASIRAIVVVLMTSSLVGNACRDTKCECTLSIASCRTTCTIVCWDVRHILVRLSLRMMLVSVGQVGITGAERATLPSGSGDVSTPYSKVLPLPCVLWLPGPEDALSACHEAFYLKEVSHKSSIGSEHTSMALASENRVG